MNERRHASGRASLSADHDATYPDRMVAHVQEFLPALPTLHHGVKETSDLLKRLVRDFNGSLVLRLWNGTTFSLGNAGYDNPGPPFTWGCRHPGVVRSMVLGHDPLGLAETYFRGEIDIEGDFFAALGLKDPLHSIRMSTLDRVGAVFSALRLRSPHAARPGVAAAGSPLRGRSVRVDSRGCVQPRAATVEAGHRERVSLLGLSRSAWP